jgi:hypothetical protein
MVSIGDHSGLRVVSLNPMGCESNPSELINPQSGNEPLRSTSVIPNPSIRHDPKPIPFISRPRNVSPSDHGVLVGYLTTLSMLEPYIVDERMINKYGANGGMKLSRKNQNTRRNPARMPLCPPQIPHDGFYGGT